MFKVNNKDILVSLLLTLEYFTPYSKVSIVNFIADKCRVGSDFGRKN